jgi:hypothetical protein
MIAHTAHEGRNFRYEYVRPIDLKIDPIYHATERFNEKRARVISQNWDDQKMGMITASQRGTDLILIDGNHRRWAAIDQGIDRLFAKVYFDLSQAEEANIFIGLSAAVPLSQLDLWQARRVYGDPIVLGVEGTLATMGCRVVRGGANASAVASRAVGTLERIYLASPVLLIDTVTLLRTAWPESTRALDSVLLQAVSSFLYCYRMTSPPCNERRLLDRMTVATPEAVHRAEQLERSTSGSGSGGLGLVGLSRWTHPRNALLTIYNRGLSAKRLARLTQSDLRAISDGQTVDLAGRAEA